MSYRLAMFDFDGVLSDSLPWFHSVLDDIADRFDLRRISEQEVEALRHCPPREALQRLGVPIWKVPAIATHLRELKAAARIPLFDGALDMLERLSARGVRLAMISSDSEPAIRKALGREAAGLFAHFDCDAALFGKAPKIRSALRATAVRPAEAIYIGDELRDAEAAAKAKVPFGAATWGYAAPEALRACAPAEVFEGLADILRIAV